MALHDYYTKQNFLPTKLPAKTKEFNHSLFTKEVIEYKSTYNKFVKNQCIVFNIWKVVRGTPQAENRSFHSESPSQINLSTLLELPHK